ncbi:MAG: isoleucine--tRNA ligase [Myxococcota bacterium]|nr:isoleucine--tRNA ligase [Myxococcota bacterium]
MSAFAPISSQVSFPTLEEEIIALWDVRDVFVRSVEQRPEDSRYVFYDGPPFATGLPHYGHLVASTLKDIVPRYWAMRGRRVERRFGWDTHGLPIEMLVEKKLGLSGPTSIREYGIGNFNEACRANVLTYTEEWRRVITRLGRWVDFDNDYKTMDPSFMESVWWVFKELWNKDLVYEGFRVMPYSWRLSTSLSNFEANMDYRDVQDPAITITAPLLDSDEVLLLWTTTPWTLPSNLAVAVGEDITYVRAKKKDDDTVYILAKERLKSILGKKAQVLSELQGSELVGRRYTPLFSYFADHENAFQVIASSHVTTGDGTGLVHMAPDFGEDDYAACLKVNISVLQSVDDEGNFVAAVTDYAGRNIKEADADIIRDLKAAGRLLRHDTINHSYPFCWRSGTPLIYRALPARFINVTALRDRMVAHNKKIHWVPDAVGSGRFGNWLADARDWNVSRNRFWGTPLPIWRCESCESEVCFGSIAELEQRAGEAVTDLHPHRIDHLTFPCEACGESMTRIPDVFDCWFESGSMPYAQDHYPFEGKDAFEKTFPAEFIAEGLDQTRGWFYTLLVLSTALFDKPPFENCIVNGMVLAEDGSKMSKSKQNYPPPDEVLNEYGADALRAYLINSPIVRAEPLRFSKAGVREVVRTVMLPLRNAWSFFTQYANIDGWHPTTGMPGAQTPDVADRPELDRWVLSVLQSLVAEVNTQMEGYYLYNVVPPMLEFIDHLTNWYIRRSRRRFWRSAEDAEGLADKASAYATLYEVLTTFAKITAPVLPFISEALYQHLVVVPCDGDDKDSVHLCDYPQVNTALIDTDLEAQIAAVRSVVGMGRALRERHRLKIRQPLRRVTVVNHEPAVCQMLQHHADLICEELNVKGLATRANADELAAVSFKANFKRLGRRFGRQMRDAAAAIGTLTAADWQVMQAGGTVDILGQAITAEDVMVTRTPMGDVVIETAGAMTVALDTELDDALRSEGLFREVTSRVQRLRKETGLQVTDRINLVLLTEDAALLEAIDTHGEAIATEVLAVSVSRSGEAPHAVDLDGIVLSIGLTKA